MPAKMYFWTESMDKALREAYAKCSTLRVSPAVDLIVRMTGFPRVNVRGRAQLLGLTRPGKPWKMQEIAFVREHAGQHSAKWIAAQLHRSHLAVEGQMERHRISRVITAGYSREEAASALGVCPHQIADWLVAKKLKLNEHGRIGIFSIEEFFAANYGKMDLRTMDQAWLKEQIRKLSGKRVLYRDRRRKKQLELVEKAKAA